MLRSREDCKRRQITNMIYYRLIPNPQKDVRLDQSHFSCRLWRRPHNGYGFHTLWLQVFMGCTYGVQEMPKTYIIHKGRRDIWKPDPLQIICSIKGHGSVIADANLDFNPHLGDGLWSVMFNTKGKFRVDCKQQKSVVLKRNMVLPIKKLFGVKEKKEATNILQFKKVNTSKHFHEQEVSMIQRKDSFQKKKIHSVAMIKNQIKQFVPMTLLKTKTKVNENLLNKYKMPIMHIQAKRQTDPHQKIQTTKTMYVIEKPASHKESIKAKSLLSVTKQKGSVFYSMRDVSKALKIRHLPKHNIVSDNIYNFKKLSDKTPTLVTTATALQKIKSAATNLKMQTAVITEDYNGEWDTQPEHQSTKTELEIDPELRFITKEQTITPQSTSQTLGLRMREESSDEKTVEEEGKGEVELKNAGDNPLCKGLIHQTEAGLVHCKDRLEKSNRKSIHRGLGGRESQSFHTDESDGAEYDHFYYFDGVLKRVKNNPINQQF
ncbi:uncharacterized protein LOC129408887 [Boleophthalmus pectinirostris]|uniref:uncharacterized protein LOC129408887 n=1 Tax=Boleophthalmus pectinirostris TaxID=150288 RepID=UPI00242B42D8|nr:uncharacterized protein LOC129408887 [Boleophthalmus pectinirostris]XP_055009230.1 uncharacterized protein LOC129408887 [Boleophthalmus pectinirostris]